MAGETVATNRVFAEDRAGVRRLVAAAGDVVPANARAVGIVTPLDPPTVLEPLAGYGSLDEVAVLDLLPGLSLAELEAVQAYERSHLARGSITRYAQTSLVVTGGELAPEAQAAAHMGAVAAGDALPPALAEAGLEVPAQSTSAGYAGVSTPDLESEVTRRGLTVRGSGRGGKPARKDLIAALQAADARA